jgi:hypothetical protein
MSNQDQKVVNIDNFTTDLIKKVMTVNDVMKKINGENQELKNIISIMEKEIGEERIKELFPKPTEEG